MNSLPSSVSADYLAAGAPMNVARRWVSALIAWVKRAPEPNTVDLSRWDVYVQWSVEIPGLALPLTDLLAEPVHGGQAVIDRGQISPEPVSQHDAL